MVVRRSFAILAWLAVALAACGDEPMPPVACGAIPQQTVTVGEQVLVEPCFEDPEMAAFTLAAVSSHPEVAAAEVVGDKVQIAGVSPGTATITVTATDPNMLVGELSFEVLVPNRPPALLGELPPTRMHTGDSPVKLVLSEYFADPDGQQLTYRATSSDTTVASVAVTADTLVVVGGSQGEATVTVTATDPGGLSATAQMTVMVQNRPPVVAKELPSAHIQPGRPPVRLVLSEYFFDPDGQPLTYGATSSDTTVASVAILADTLLVTGGSEGMATVSVTATDPGGLSATARMRVTVSPNRPPVVIKELRPTHFYPGGPPVRLVLSEYFADPDGELLAYGAMSSDTMVASVEVTADTLVVAGGAEGTATVFVTATDPGGLTATARMTVTVGPNAPPAVVEAPQPVILIVPAGWGTSAKRFFSDPDGDTLLYNGASSDPSVVYATIWSDGWMWLRILRPGAVTVSVTATDPGGLSATTEFEVKGVPRTLPFQDNFESDESLDGWVLFADATAEFGDGMVRVTHPNKPGKLYAGLLRSIDAKNWTVSARMGNVTEDSWVQLFVWLLPPNRPADGFFLQVGADPKHHWTQEDTNWRLVARYDKGRRWDVIASGESEAVGSSGELVDVTLSHVGSRLSVSIGDSVVFSSTKFGWGSVYSTTHLTLGVWPARGSTAPKTGVFDWVEVKGDTTGSWEPDEVNGDTANWGEVNREGVETWGTGPKRDEVEPLLRQLTKPVAPPIAPMARQVNGPALRGRRQRPTTA